MIVGGIAGQPWSDLVELELGENGDAVEGLLAVGHHVVAERLDGLAGKRLIEAFGLLQADDVGRTILQPGQEMIQPLPDRIDVPRCDAHQKVRSVTNIFVLWHTMRRRAMITRLNKAQKPPSRGRKPGRRGLLADRPT